MMGLPSNGGLAGSYVAAAPEEATGIGTPSGSGRAGPPPQDGLNGSVPLHNPMPAESVSGGGAGGNYQTFGGYAAEQVGVEARERQPSNTITGGSGSASLDPETDQNVEAMVFNLKQRFKQSGVTLPLEKQQAGGVYRLGSRKLQLSVRNNRLTVRVGSNNTDFLEFLSKAAF